MANDSPQVIAESGFDVTAKPKRVKDLIKSDATSADLRTSLAKTPRSRRLKSVLSRHRLKSLATEALSATHKPLQENSKRSVGTITEIPRLPMLDEVSEVNSLNAPPRLETVRQQSSQKLLDFNSNSKKPNPTNEASNSKQIEDVSPRRQLNHGLVNPDHEQPEVEARTHVEDEEELDTIEMEILQPGQSSKASEQIFFQPNLSPKRTRNSIKQVSQGSSPSQRNAEDTDNQDAEQQPSPKKLRRTNCRNPRLEARDDAALQELQGRRASRKDNRGEMETDEAIPDSRRNRKPRRLPVNELVVVSEKIDRYDSEEYEDVEPGELPEDPISVLSLSIHSPGPANRRSRKSRASRNVIVELGRIHIDISDFRMPKARTASPRSRRRLRDSHAPCDGFEGKEARPIGRFMPIRQSHKRRETLPQITYRMNELTLVPERPDEVRAKQSSTRSTKVKHQRNKVVQPAQEEDAASRSGEEPVGVDFLFPAGAGNADGHGQAKTQLNAPEDEQNTPEITENDNSRPLTPTTNSSPLKRKSQLERGVICQEDDIVAPQQSRESISHARRLFQRNESHGMSASQELKLVKSHKRSPLKLKPQDEITVSQEMMTVRIRRPVNYSDSESEDSDYADDVGTDEQSSEMDFEEEVRSGEVSGEEPDSEDPTPEIAVNPVQFIQDASQELETVSILRGQHNHSEESWRPRQPRMSSEAIEVNEEIEDSPRSSHPRPPRRLHSSRAPSRTRSRPLTTTSRRVSSVIATAEINLNISQGSVELGDSQRFVRESILDCIPETQMEDPVNPVEERSSQQSFIPQSSYFDRASQQLSALSPGVNFGRFQSMPAKKNFLGQVVGTGLMMGGITQSQAFAHTISPIKSNPLPTLLQQTPAPRKSLLALTRKASLDIGTIPSSSRRRMVSMPFKPPFKSGTEG